jgi:hypothetical protein
LTICLFLCLPYNSFLTPVFWVRKISNKHCIELKIIFPLIRTDKDVWIECALAKKIVNEKLSNCWFIYFLQGEGWDKLPWPVSSLLKGLLRWLTNLNWEIIQVRWIYTATIC